MKATEGMHRKFFFDGRVIFVEEAKPRSDIQRAETKPQILRTWELS